MYTRARRIHSGLSNEMLRMAVEQFVPSAVAGFLITLVLLRAVPGEAWMIPGMLQAIFALGIFSSCRFLPRPMIAAGAWYLLCGLSCLAMAGTHALSPWAMGVPFGAGQFLVAAILFFNSAEEEHEA
jgi:ABC-type cobalamin transport system permease subunit